MATYASIGVSPQGAINSVQGYVTPAGPSQGTSGVPPTKPPVVIVVPTASGNITFG